MKRVIIAALMLAFAARAQDAATWWNALAADGAEGLPDVTDGLVAWWKLDGNANDSIDSYNGVITDATNAVGKINGAYGFNGSTSKISCGPLTNHLSGSFSFSAWCFVNEDTPYVKQAMASERVTSLYRACLGIFERKFSFGVYDGVNNPYLVSSAQYPLREWTHLVGVRNTSTGKIRLFVNGAFDVETEDTSGNPGAYSAFLIGSQSNQIARTWNGLVDDARIYNRALSSNEVNTIYNRYR